MYHNVQYIIIVFGMSSRLHFIVIILGGSDETIPSCVKGNFILPPVNVCLFNNAE